MCTVQYSKFLLQQHIFSCDIANVQIKEIYLLKKRKQNFSVICDKPDADCQPYQTMPYTSYTDKKENQIFLIYKELGVEQLQSHI
jgi:hypothetical protein